MGDLLHALPAVTALRTALPHASLGWAVEPHWAPLLSPALVDQVHLVPSRAWKQAPVSIATARSILELRRELRGQQYELVVDLQGSIRSAVIARLAGAPRVAGPAAPREAFAARLYHRRIVAHAPDVISQAVEIISAALALPLFALPPILPRDAAAERWADALELPEHFTLLLPGAGWGAKQWPHFAALARELAATGHRCVVNATPNAATFPEARFLPATIPQLIAITRRASLAIGGDTGPMHLAAALGRPTLALFGPTDPARNGPHFPQNAPSVCPVILRSPASQTSYRRTAAPEAGLAAITVDEVLAAALALLETP